MELKATRSLCRAASSAQAGAAALVRRHAGREAAEMADDERAGCGVAAEAENGGCASCGVPRPVQEVPGDRIRLTQLSSKAG